MLYGDYIEGSTCVCEAILGGWTTCVPTLKPHLCDAGPKPAVTVVSTQSFKRWRRLSENLQGGYNPDLPTACTLCERPACCA